MSLSPSHFMAVAQVVSTAGTCSRRQVGCVVVKDRRIISTGYNGSPAGMDHCSHSGQYDIACRESVHAEANAIYYAARAGISTLESVIYTTDEPCRKCAEAIINAGIKAVLYMRAYTNHDGTILLEAAKIPVGIISQPRLPDVSTP